MKILKLSDRIEIKSGEIKMLIAPLSLAQKIEIAGITKINGGELTGNQLEQAYKVVKYCLKGIEGLKCYDDSDYVPVFENGSLDDNSVDEIISSLSNTNAFDSITKVLAGDFNIDGAEVKVIPNK
jgi:hypothetical protein